MPDVARQRVSFGTRGPAPRRPVAAATASRRRRAVRSDGYSPQASERRRPRGATGRFMNRLDLSMRAVSVQWLVGSLGAIAALAHGSVDPDRLRRDRLPQRRRDAFGQGRGERGARRAASSPPALRIGAPMPAGSPARSSRATAARRPSCSASGMRKGPSCWSRASRPRLRHTSAARRSWSAARRSAGPWSSPACARCWRKRS